MREKVCFKCSLLKPLTEFYRHPKMADGRLGKCKTCAKADVISNREKRIEYYRAYDIDRGGRKDAEATRRYREANPIKCEAHKLVAKAIKSGRLIRQSCEVCGGDQHVHAHHDDYSQPYQVRWLCAAHHAEWHKENGEGANAQ